MSADDDFAIEEDEDFELTPADVSRVRRAALRHQRQQNDFQRTRLGLAGMALLGERLSPVGLSVLRHRGVAGPDQLRAAGISDSSLGGSRVRAPETRHAEGLARLSAAAPGSSVSARDA